MKVRVKNVFLDDNGIHRVGEICEVSTYQEDRMELIEEEKPKAEKPAQKKTTKK